MATVLDRVKRWLLDENNGHWLMVVDSADHFRYIYKTTGRHPA